MDSRKRIVIVGGGFGGVYACFYLQKHFRGMKNPPHITLINKEDYFLFTPLLHEAATGSVRPSNIIFPLEKIIDSCAGDLFVARAEQIDLNRGAVITDRGEAPYDYLVLAAGGETRRYDFPQKDIFELKSLEDAARLKNRVIEMFEKASETDDPSLKKKLLTFVVIGGGPTGVELIAELREFIYGTLFFRYPRVKKEEVSLCLIHARGKLLAGFDPFIQEKSEQVLKEKNNVKIVFHAKVDRITSQSIHLDNGEKIETATPILVAGISPVTLKFFPQISLDPSGQIPVNSFLQLPENPNVFVIGDMAQITDPKSGTKTPQTAQAAVGEARAAASNILAMLDKKPLTPFKYREKGQLVSLGRWNAAAKINGFKFSGPLAWWIWRTVYASKIIGWRNRIRVVADWTIGIFYPRDTTKL